MKIVILDGKLLNPGDVSWKPLEKFGEIIVYEGTSPQEFPERVKGADIVLVNKTRVTAENVGFLSDCRLVGELATGFDNIDIKALARARIPVCNVPAYGPEDVAQHAIAMLLELSRHTCLHSQSVKNGGWVNSGKWCYWLKAPRSLAGRTIGIIGFGGIGQVTGKIAFSLGMKILAFSRRKNVATSYPFSFASLDEIWQNADVISLHCPLVPETEKLINEKTLAAMKEGTILINTARGGLVDEYATARALIDGKLAGFGTDVLSTEPPAPDNPLLTAPNTLITPHMAWATPEARQRIIDIMAANISSFLNGKLDNSVSSF